MWDIFPIASKVLPFVWKLPIPSTTAACDSPNCSDRPKKWLMADCFMMALPRDGTGHKTQKSPFIWWLKLRICCMSHLVQHSGDFFKSEVIFSELQICCHWLVNKLHRATTWSTLYVHLSRLHMQSNSHPHRQFTAFKELKWINLVGFVVLCSCTCRFSTREWDIKESKMYFLTLTIRSALFEGVCIRLTWCHHIHVMTSVINMEDSSWIFTTVTYVIPVQRLMKWLCLRCLCYDSFTLSRLQKLLSFMTHSKYYPLVKAKGIIQWTELQWHFYYKMYHCGWEQGKYPLLSYNALITNVKTLVTYDSLM